MTPKVTRLLPPLPSEYRRAYSRTTKNPQASQETDDWPCRARLALEQSDEVDRSTPEFLTVKAELGRVRRALMTALNLSPANAQLLQRIEERLNGYKCADQAVVDTLQQQAALEHQKLLASYQARLSGLPACAINRPAEPVAASSQQRSQHRLWDSIIGLEREKNLLRSAVVNPLQWPQLYTGACAAERGVLMYGPPGTGKTSLARAVADEAGVAFHYVSAADIMRQYMGESELAVRTIFEKAEKSERSIIFLDECDSLMGKRSEGASDPARRVQNELLANMDGLLSKSHVMVVAATNRETTLDPGFQRRFEMKLYVGLPDRATRRCLFERKLADVPALLAGSALDYETYADRTEAFSGADITNIIKEAVDTARQRITGATHFFTAENGDVHPVPLGANLDDYSGVFALPKDPSTLNVRLDVRPTDIDAAIAAHRSGWVGARPSQT